MTPLPFARTFMLTLSRYLADPKAKVHATVEHLRQLEIPAEPFLGLGAESGLMTTNYFDHDHPGTGYRVAPRNLNMLLGHAMMWRVCEYLDGDSFLFLEDDVRFQPDWRAHFDFALPSLPPDWDLIYIGSCCVTDKPTNRVSGHLHRIQYALCTHAYAVRKKALPVLYKACMEKVYAPVDIAMCLHGIPKLNAFAFLPRLADQFETEIHS